MPVACGCRSSGECWHLTERQWREMGAEVRRIVRARRQALEELLYHVQRAMEDGAPMPERVIQAVRQVEQAGLDPAPRSPVER